MYKKIAIFSFVAFMGLVAFLSAPSALAAGNCLCVGGADAVDPGGCLELAQNMCNSNNLSPEWKSTGCTWVEDAGVCKQQYDAWKIEHQGLIDKAAQEENRKKYGELIPECALKDTLTDECKDVSIFIDLLIKIANYLFTIIGSLALLVFVYGGFMMVISAGNSDKVAQGKDAMVAAVVGLAVAFGGYMLIKIVSTSLGVNVL